MTDRAVTFAVERARSRGRRDPLVVGEPVLVDNTVWWVTSDDGGKTLHVAREDGRGREIERWRARQVPAYAAPVCHSTTTPAPSFVDCLTPESTLAWLREVRDRSPGSPLEEWLPLAEARNARMSVGRWPPGGAS